MAAGDKFLIDNDVTDKILLDNDLTDVLLIEAVGVAGGRIMSSIAGAGGLAGSGGIAGQGGGLAG